MTGRYLLEWMALHRARRTPKVWRKARGCVGGEPCRFVIQHVFSGAFDEAMPWCACAVRRLDTVCWFMLVCVAFSVYCHTGSEHKCKIRQSCVLNTALDLAAAALCIGWRVGRSYVWLT